MRHFEPSLVNTIPNLIAAAYTHWQDAERLGTIGTELESRSRLDWARTILGRALELNPVTHPEWYLSFAFAHFRDVANLSGEGERILIDGIEETDSDFLKAAYLSVLEGSTADDGIEDLIEYLSTSEDISVQFALGHSLLWRGEPENALLLLRRAIAALDDQTPSELPLGLDMYCGAMNWMRAQNYPHDDATNNNGTTEHPIDLTSEVLPYLQRLTAAHPNTYNFRALTIQMHQTLRDYAAVRDTAREILRVFPDEETTMAALASAFEKLGDDEQAIIWYNRAIGAKPSFVRARVMLGKLYERCNNTLIAEQIFREIPTAFPEYNLGRLEIAYFLHRTGRTDEATSLFRYGYDRLKTFEKGAVEQHPDGKALLEQMNKFSLPILS